MTDEKKQEQTKALREMVVPMLGWMLPCLKCKENNIEVTAISATLAASKCVDAGWRYNGKHIVCPACAERGPKE